jgi:hypothetical protein
MIEHHDSSGDDNWEQAFRRFAAEHPIPKPPPIVKQRLIQAFKNHQGRSAAPIHQMAHLVFDSRDDAVLVGVRGVGEVEERYQRSFASETHGVLLDFLPLDDHAVGVDGQVLGVESSSRVWHAQVFFPSGSTSDIGGDEYGCFSIEVARPDIDRLRLTNGELIIDVDDPLGRVES